ncbi:fumarylacetoacetate hydrolase family protein [Parasphingorhabdus sp.]|uniref:fumarylacetoacetate hydrolase family protein n=1 Tax=Parasphingorhabdus sp. TaxID=2709688 RepID=UPI002B26D181|nr:fumarylacetoacetate hydrolase family protein [Parasphingorhabdus sp.]
MAELSLLPEDSDDAILVGRLWIGTEIEGPRVVKVCGSSLVDLSMLAPTMSDLCDLPDPAAVVQSFKGPELCSLEEALACGSLLAPCDLQAIKACGVTFAISAIERVVEERAQGDAKKALNLRGDLADALGTGIDGLKPGTPDADRLKSALIEKGVWSQYLEVAIGPDPEIFTKAQPMSAVGCGAAIGVRPDSKWNNPEPEIVLAISSSGTIIGATLGNDVNLRDFEGRSALLLGTAKDNNASCAIGPFIRLFDNRFSIENIRSAIVDLSIKGSEGFDYTGSCAMSDISRTPEALVSAVFGEHHDYPDGFMLFLGTMCIPVEDRSERGMGFAHREGDLVRIHSARLGTLENFVTATNRAPRWQFGARALMKSLSARRLL